MLTSAWLGLAGVAPQLACQGALAIQSYLLGHFRTPVASSQTRPWGKVELEPDQPQAIRAWMPPRLEMDVQCAVLELELDQYDRRIARCDVSGEDLSQWLVSSGLAMAFRRYSDHFAADEDAARTAGVGLWQTDFGPPWEFRDKRWTTAAQEAPDGCPIKGNINEDGERIYHTPWGSQWYTRTRVSTGQGERWFCSEREALDAGWRAPLR